MIVNSVFLLFSTTQLMAIFVVGVHSDGSFTIDDINAEHERITGFKRDAIRNKALDEFVPATSARGH